MTLPRSQDFARMARWHEGLALYLALRASGFGLRIDRGGLATTGIVARQFSVCRDFDAHYSARGHPGARDKGAQLEMV
jgi:hypothetical protein